MNSTKFFSLSLIITLIIRSVISGPGSSKMNLRLDVCWTRQCRKVSEMLKNNMEPDESACDDFYEYVCGKFAESNVPRDTARLDHYDSIKHIEEEKVIVYLNSTVDEKDSPFMKWAKKQYKACMNVRRLRRVGVKPLMDEVQRCGGWTMCKRNPIGVPTRWHVVHNFYNRLMGKGGVFTIGVKYIPEAHENMIVIGIVEDVFGQKRGSLQSSDIEKYTQFLINMTAQICHISFEAPLTKDNVKAIVNVMEFRKTLARIKDTTKPHSTQQCAMPIHKLQAHVDERNRKNPINWLELVASTFQGIRTGGIADTTMIFIDNCLLFEAIRKAIDDTPEEVIIDHLHFYFLENYIGYTDMKTYQETDNNDLMPRSTTCIAERALTQASNFIYIQHILPTDTVLKAEKVVLNVRHSLKEQISRTRWMKKQAKKIAIEDIDRMYELLERTEPGKNPKMVPKYYSDLPLSDKYVENTLNFDRFSYSKELSLLAKQPKTSRNKGIFKASGSIVYPDTESHIDHDESLFAKRTKMLRLPFFGVELPRAVNYAGYGAFHGELLADVMEKASDRTSSRANRHWDKISAAKFENRWVDYAYKMTHLVPKEFAAAKVNIMPREPHIAQAISQYMGLVAAYEAYRKKKPRIGQWTKLIDFEDIDGDKLFFVAYALNRCEAINAKEFASAMNVANNNMDFSARLTVNVALSNMQAFTNAFGCERNEPMNPSVKCQFFSESVNNTDLYETRWRKLRVPAEKERG